MEGDTDKDGYHEDDDGDDAGCFVLAFDGMQQRSAPGGWATLDIGPALDEPLEMRDQIDRAIALMFESFPVPLGGMDPPVGEGR